MGSNKLVQAGAYTWFLFKNPSIVFCMEDHVQREWWMSTENIAFPSRKTQEEAHTAFLDVMRKAGYTLVFLDGSIERLESKENSDDEMRETGEDTPPDWDEEYDFTGPGWHWPSLRKEVR